MNYLKMLLKTDVFAYGLREYFPYTDKPFFKTLDDIIVDESLVESLGHLFVKLYKDELIFEYPNVDSHKYITFVKHESKKFENMNRKLTEKIASILNIDVVYDYFDECSVPRVDIRDDYTKESFCPSIAINEKYINTPIIIFDCCCSTGVIFENISNKEKISKNNLYLVYGVRYNCHELNKTYIKSLSSYEFDSSKYNFKNPGYLVRIFGLFGNKNVEVDFRSPFSIFIGENGFGKSTAVKIALLAMKLIDSEFVDEFNNTSDELEKADVYTQLSSYFFEKIEIYYSNYYYDFDLLREIDEKAVHNNIGERVFHDKFGYGNITNVYNDQYTILFDDNKIGIKTIISSKIQFINENNNSKKHLIRFWDINDFCFHEQYVNDNGYIDIEELKSLKLLDDSKIKEILSKKIDHSQDFKIDRNVLEYDYIKEIGEYGTALEKVIFYEETIPSKNELLALSTDNQINEFLEKINILELNSIIRKIIVEDRSIEMDYNDLAIKYKLSIDFNVIDLWFRKIIKENNKQDDSFLSCNDLLYFNCTKARNIVAKPPRDRIKLDFYSDDLDEGFEIYDEPDDYIEIIDCDNDLDEDDYRRYDNKGFDYDDPDNDIYNSYEDFDDKWDNLEIIDPSYDRYLDEKNEEKNKPLIDIFSYYASSREQKIAFNPIVNGKTISNFLIDIFKCFESNNIAIHEILHNSVLVDNDNQPIVSNFYSIVEKVCDLFDGKVLDKDIIINHEKINQCYNTIFEQYNKFSFGVYDILNKTQFEKIYIIIRELRFKGLKDEKDYIITAGLYILMKSFDDFKSSRYYLFEKLINKYLINKRANVYPNSLVIVDNNNKYIPINKLSTGEKNLIILFSLCLFSKDNKIIILDEPDLSMSVDWQSKILVDLLKYTNHRYIVISQSPLLVQKNDLSSFVKRMDYDESINIVDLYKLKIVSPNVNRNTDYIFKNDLGF